MPDEYQIIRTRPFLREVYRSFYRRMARALAADHNRVLELGSGAGCIRDVIPSAIRSDVRMTPAVDLLCSAYDLPVADLWLDAIVMLNVFHHLDQPDAFLAEAARCLRPGGLVILIDPTDSLFARFIWRFHHEVFYTGADYRKYHPNQALSWMIFVKEASKLQMRCPGLRIRKVERFSDMAYVLSGGLGHTVPWPRCLYWIVDLIDRLLGSRLALMQMVVLEKR
ncbi:MAG: class I SAM-dependent methyltransferase [Sedimentisphaerales bacterium]|nr:class I SAM-dependent methyltransferase [Sedimentisphaerales bacterium]